MKNLSYYMFITLTFFVTPSQALVGTVNITEAFYEFDVDGDGNTEAVGQYIVENATDLNLVAFGVKNNTTTEVFTPGFVDIDGDGFESDFWAAAILNEISWSDGSSFLSPGEEFGIDFNDFFASGDSVNFYQEFDSSAFIPGRTVEGVFLFTPAIFASEAIAILIDDNFNEFVAIAPNVSAVPLPAAVWLFGSGFLGLLGYIKRNKAIKF